jgi:hypothetical protein
LNVGRWLSVGCRGDDHVLIDDELGGEEVIVIIAPDEFGREQWKFLANVLI